MTSRTSAGMTEASRLCFTSSALAIPSANTPSVPGRAASHKSAFAPVRVILGLTCTRMPRSPSRNLAYCVALCFGVFVVSWFLVFFVWFLCVCLFWFCGCVSFCCLWFLVCVLVSLLFLC